MGVCELALEDNSVVTTHTFVYTCVAGRLALIGMHHGVSNIHTLAGNLTDPSPLPQDTGS